MEPECEPPPTSPDDIDLFAYSAGLHYEDIGHAGPMGRNRMTSAGLEASDLDQSNFDELALFTEDPNLLADRSSFCSGRFSMRCSSQGSETLIVGKRIDSLRFTRYSNSQGSLPQVTCFDYQNMCLFESPDLQSISQPRSYLIQADEFSSDKAPSLHSMASTSSEDISMYKQPTPPSANARKTKSPRKRRSLEVLGSSHGSVEANFSREGPETSLASEDLGCQAEVEAINNQLEDALSANSFGALPSGSAVQAALCLKKTAVIRQLHIEVATSQRDNIIGVFCCSNSPILLSSCRFGKW